MADISSIPIEKLTEDEAAKELERLAGLDEDERDKLGTMMDRLMARAQALDTD